MQCDVSDNEVDGFSFFHLREADITAMFPGKVGLSLRVSCLVSEVKGVQENVVCHYFYDFAVLNANKKLMILDIKINTYFPCFITTLASLLYDL